MIQTLFGNPDPEEAADQDQKKSFLHRMRQAVSRTRETFSSKISDLAALTRTVDESSLEELETVLLTSDLGVPTTTAILDALRDRARHQAIQGGAELRNLLKEQMIAILRAPQGIFCAVSSLKSRCWLISRPRKICSSFLPKVIGPSERHALKLANHLRARSEACSMSLPAPVVMVLRNSSSAMRPPIMMASCVSR